MINSLYQIFNKGSLRTLSFIFAILITLFFFFNINDFSTNLRSAPAPLILLMIGGRGFSGFMVLALRSVAHFGKVYFRL